MMAEFEAKRARLAAVERELAGLSDRHDLAMSAFKFDEAREMQQRIAVLERERGELVEALPALAEPSPVAPPPVRVRHRRLVQRRRQPLRR
jgi:acyl transferase domain-containing protein